MLKFETEITDMLVFGRNYCCSRRVIFKGGMEKYFDLNLFGLGHKKFWVGCQILWVGGWQNI